MSNTQNLLPAPIMTGEQLRAKAMGILGYDGVVFKDLNANEKKRVAETSAQVILDSPSSFTEAQVAVATTITNRKGYGSDYDSGDDPNLFDAFLDGAREGFSKSVGSVSKTVGQTADGVFKASPLISLTLIGLAAFALYIVLKK